MALSLLGLDTSANTVKIDPAANTVKVSGTVVVDGAVALKTGGVVGVSSLPAINGTVEVTKMPELTLKAGQLLAISAAPPLNIASLPAINGTVAVSALPDVGIKPDQKIEVSKLPAVTGKVEITNFPPAPVVGPLEIYKLPAVTIDAMPPITGSVDVAALPPVTGRVDIGEMPTITGEVAVSALPPMTGQVEITKAPAVEIAKLPPVIGKVAVSKLPKVSGTVTVSKLPPVTGAVEVTKLPRISVTNLPDAPDNMRFACTAAGGRVGFGATVGSAKIADMPTASPSADQVVENPVSVVIAMLHNPTDSGVDCNIDTIVLGASAEGQFIRMGFPKRVEFIGDPVHSLNRGGGANASKTRLYDGRAGRGYTGIRSKVTFCAAYETKEDHLGGTIILRPGMSVCWLFDGNYGLGTICTITTTWWETPAVP